MREFFEKVRTKLIIDQIKSGDMEHKELEKAFAKRLEECGWKRVEFRNFVSYGKNGCYIDLEGFGFDITSGLISSSCFYDELDLNPVDSEYEPMEKNIIYVGTFRLDLNAPIETEEDHWGDADGPFMGHEPQSKEEEEDD